MSNKNNGIGNVSIENGAMNSFESSVKSMENLIGLLDNEISIDKIRETLRELNMDSNFAYDGETVTMKMFFARMVKESNNLIEQYKKSPNEEILRQAVNHVKFVRKVIENVCKLDENVIEDFINKSGFKGCLEKLEQELSK